MYDTVLRAHESTWWVLIKFRCLFLYVLNFCSTCLRFLKPIAFCGKGCSKVTKYYCVCCLYEIGRNDFDAGNINYSGHQKSRLIWAQMALASLVAISGPKKVSIFRAHPFQWPELWICPHQNQVRSYASYIFYCCLFFTYYKNIFFTSTI